ncbi:hypothetical protein HWI79_1474 [Cryptosporidium felis]|nr:hypothetical protein HWI79_1474 [Cryptosporidium felis]
MGDSSDCIENEIKISEKIVFKSNNKEFNSNIRLDEIQLTSGIIESLISKEEAGSCNGICVVRNSHKSRFGSFNSILTIDSNFGIVENEADVKRGCILSIIGILKNQVDDNFQCNDTQKNIDYYYSLFIECISNFVIEGFENFVIEAMIDILLPEKNSNLFVESDLGNNLNSFQIIPSILYYYLVEMTKNDLIFINNSTIYSKSAIRSNHSLLPISKSISEVEYSWLLRHNNYLNGESKNSVLKKNEIIKERIDLFSDDHIPILLKKLVNYLKTNYSIFIHKINCIQDFKLAYLLVNSNFFTEDNNQIPFIIGRVLEICLSKSQEVFTSIFLQFNGPLIIIPFIQYSSIQDFFFRFFGLIGFTSYLDGVNGLSTQLLEIELSETNQDRCVGIVDTKKLCYEEPFLNIGISPIIYDWAIKNDFIQSLVSLISSDFNYGNRWGSFAIKEIVNKQTECQYIAFGVIEFINRIIEYLKPEQTGLPLSMTSVGLVWPIFSNEAINNNSSSFYLQNGVNSNGELHFYKKPSDISDEELTQCNFFGIGTDRSNNKHFKSTENRTESKHKTSNQGYSYSAEIKKHEKNSLFLSSTQIKSFVVRNHSEEDLELKSEYISPYSNVNLEKTLRFMYNLIVDSPMIRSLCEIIMLTNNGLSDENVYIIKLRSLNILEEVINLAFSNNCNVISYFKREIIEAIKPFISRFCGLLISKYEIITRKGLNEAGYLVSMLTIVKLVIIYDESHELVNKLSFTFWNWLLGLFLIKREMTQLSIQCKVIFETGLRFGSCSTLNILFRDLKLIDKLSKFIYDGTNLDGIEIEESMDGNSKKRRRVLGSVKNLFMTFGKYYDSLIQIIVSSEYTTYEIKKRLIKNFISTHLNEREGITLSTKKLVDLILEKELKNPNEHINGEDLDLLFKIDPQRIILILSVLSCNTKFCGFIGNFQDDTISHDPQCSNDIPVSGSEESICQNVNNIENYSLSPNSAMKTSNRGDFLDNLSFTESSWSGRDRISQILRTYFSGDIITFLKCDKECQCPDWSFHKVLCSLILEKSSANSISVMPILSLEESKRIRESRKRQIKFDSTTQKV